MKHRRKHREPMPAFDQINVTPLLDLTFILLIAFMITMPLMQYGTDVNPPEMDSGQLPDENLLTVSLTSKGTILVKNEVVTESELIELLKRAKLDNPKLEIALQADGSRPYNEVIKLMAQMRRGGLKDVILITQAERK